MFNSKPQKSKSVLLAEESQKHISVFLSTAENLTKVNDQIDQEYDAKEAEKQTIILQQEALQITKNNNARIIEKIWAFLND
jgi:hypothetical protein